MLNAAFFSCGTTMSAGYRGDGLRAWKEDAEEHRTYYLYDGSTVIGEYSGGTPYLPHVWGADGLISRGDVFYLYDPLGNVVHRLNLDGTVRSNDAYDAWGNLLACKEPDGDPYDLTGEPYGYKGQFGYVTDRETGLILCQQRYYDPTLGRWVTRDPIGYDGGINLYGYCGNDSVNEQDPSGYIVETIVDVASIGWSTYDLIKNPSWDNDLSRL